MIGRWLVAFLFTQAVEVPIYARALGPTGRSLRRRIALAFGASAITHPFVWFVFPRIVDGYWLMVACAEAFAVLAEAAYFAALGMRHPVRWSLLANAASVTVGFTSRALFGVP